MPADPAAEAAPSGETRARLGALLNQQRRQLGLPEVASDEALERAAQRHADELAARGADGPGGLASEGIERWVEAEGYLAALVTEKLVQVPSGRSPEELAAGWAESPERNRRSLLHPEVTQLGVGVAERDGTATYALVLATPAIQAAEKALERSLGDLGRARGEYLAIVNRMRSEAGLSSLQADHTLDRPAQEHAEAILAAIGRGDAPDSVETLADRVLLARSGIGAYRGVDRETYWNVGKGRLEPRLATLGHSIVFDAASPEAAVRAALTLQESPDIREAGFRRLGLGIARGETEGVPRTVWVAVLER